MILSSTSLSTLDVARIEAALAQRAAIASERRIDKLVVTVSAAVFLCLSFLTTLTAKANGPVGTDSAVVRPHFTEAEKARILSFGPLPATPPPDPGNELSGLPWAEQLGQQLFADPRLSGNQSISCTTCHDPTLGFTDGRRVAVGVATHDRNTQGLLDAGFQRWFGWDGGSDSLWAATLRPLFSEIEMSTDVETLAARLSTPPYELTRQTVFPIDKTDDESVVVFAAKAIAAYVRTLRSPASPFDQFRDALESNDVRAQSTYPDAAQRGLKLFLGDANCHVCHTGTLFSNAEFHDTGRPFFTAKGGVDAGRYSGIQRVRTDRYSLTGRFNGTDNVEEIRKTRTVKLVQDNFGQWRTPSLRNLTQTAPYMHDGSLSTLRDVVDAYADIDTDRLHSAGESILKPLPLTDSEREDLVAFLTSLSALNP